ncbi:hypothetical protein V5799_007184 [Amblyomma americanum]|uniref:Uncharacterized protein n=1 Tax=Amblyomma americanum TaxID=6943 RepID=A0AAQ4DU95_AMBAM
MCRDRQKNRCSAPGFWKEEKLQSANFPKRKQKKSNLHRVDLSHDVIAWLTDMSEQSADGSRASPTHPASKTSPSRRSRERRPRGPTATAREECPPASTEVNHLVA